jgi:hypothetical protein
MNWVKEKSQYAIADILMLGKIKVARVYYDSLRNRDDPKAHAADCFLPGIKNHGHLDNFVTSEEAKAAAERAVEAWMARAEVCPIH